MKFIALLLLAVSAQAKVRFHFGDDPHWASGDRFTFFSDGVL